MKVITTLILLYGLSNAGILTVKDDTVTLGINGDKISLNDSQKKEFIDGSTICYEDGKGRIIINNSIQLTSKNNDCIQTKINDTGAVSKLIASLKNSFLVSFSNTKENVVDGVASKDVTLTQDNSTIKLSSEQKFIVISSDSSGPLPVTLEILDSNNQVIKRYKNTDNVSTKFIISISELTSGSKIVLTNGFGMKIKEIKINKKGLK